MFLGAHEGATEDAYLESCIFKMGLMKKAEQCFISLVCGIFKARLSLQNKRVEFTSINDTNSQTRGKKEMIVT